MDFRDVVKAGNTVESVFRASCFNALELRILMEQATGLSRIQQITQSDHVLTEEEAQKLCALLERRQSGDPIAYITGKREFFGLPFLVSPDVLIPRPETELLVERALAVLPQGGKLVDMGTGSGAIAVSVAHERPDAVVMATDVSEAALAVAKANANQILGTDGRIRFCQGSWFEAFGAGMSFDVIVSNPPYIHHQDAHLGQGDLRFEPKGALTDFSDGLSALVVLVEGAPRFLKTDGWLLMEHGYNQAKAVRQMMDQQGFTDVQSWQDLAGIERVSGGRWTVG
ncbi:MAG: peptide chain release factor N(5)-glutamine methyltransferase [Oxalobacter sp.]|nr:peptide chain release factor N(5)-glutamine methyltransferase [Oxalobacter sp.]